MKRLPLSLLAHWAGGELIGDDLAANPDEPIDPELYRTLLYVTHIAPSFSLRGGTREILRGIIARGLGLR